MSIRKHFDQDGVWILDHVSYIRKTYSESGLEPKNIFDVKSPFYMDSQAERIALEMENQSEVTVSSRKKRKIEVRVNPDPESELVRKKFEILRDLIRELFDPSPSSDMVRENNRQLRKLVSDIQESSKTELKIFPISDTNKSDKCRFTKVEGTDYVLPPNCRYFVDDLNNFNSTTVVDRKKFDVILMDPPWENKHVKRVNKRNTNMGYPLLSTESMSNSLSKIVCETLEQNSGLVLIWCTRSEKQQNAIKDWAENWKLTLKAKWFWLKLTKSGEPVTDLWSDRQHKLPFEMIWIFASSQNTITIPDEQILMSVPCGVHSHKPPISEVLSSMGLINRESEKLELFGRNLLPGWTTFGIEALKFQELIYFEQNVMNPKVLTI